MRLIAFFSTLVLGIGSAQAQNVEVKVQEISRSLAETSDKLNANEEMNLSTLSALAKDLEAVMAQMREVDREFGAEREQARQKFFDQSGELREILGFLVTNGSAEIPDYLIHPEGALASVQANIISAEIVPQFSAKLSMIATDLAQWREIDLAQAELHETARNASLAIDEVREALVDRDRSDEPQRIVDNPMVLDTVFAASQSMDEFVSKMRNMRLVGAKAPKSNFVKGGLVYPVLGNANRYREGVKIRTQDTLVASPVAATVRFATSFLDYGNIVILEPKPDVLLVFAGMDIIAVEEGEIVQNGDALGFFASVLVENAQNGEMPLAISDHDLYIEARENGYPVDVRDYFVPNN